ncbi:MAG: hypothetical protein ACRDHZ_03815, partial [Ktedonobacteraceae bacterium]
TGGPAWGTGRGVPWIVRPVAPKSTMRCSGSQVVFMERLQVGVVETGWGEGRRRRLAQRRQVAEKRGWAVGRRLRRWAPVAAAGGSCCARASRRGVGLVLVRGGGLWRGCGRVWGAARTAALRAQHRCEDPKGKTLITTGT